MKQDMESQLKRSTPSTDDDQILIAQQCFDSKHGAYGQSMAKILINTGEKLIADIYRADKAELQTESFDTLPPILEGRNLYKQLAIGKEQTKAWESWNYLLSVMLSPMSFAKMLNRHLFGNKSHASVRREILASIIAISWALYNRAIIEQEKIMDRGSFTIHDPEYRLYNYLLNYIQLATRSSNPGFFISANDFGYDRNPKEYRSSHYLEDEMQHGGDIRLWGGGPALPLLPNQATTYLFGAIEKNGQSLFWIKFEEWGLGNWMESIFHLLCFLKAGHVEPTNVYREKDIPLQMRQAYTAFKQLLKNDQNLPANTIHGMWREMLAQYKKQPNHLIAGLLQSFKEAAIAHKFDPEKLTYRTGSEVIFDYQDLFQSLNQPLLKEIEFDNQPIVRYIPKDYTELYLNYQTIAEYMTTIMLSRKIKPFLEDRYATEALKNDSSPLYELSKMLDLSEFSYQELLEIKTQKSSQTLFMLLQEDFKKYTETKECEFYSLSTAEKEMYLFFSITNLAKSWLNQLNYLIHHQEKPERLAYRKMRDQFFNTGQSIYQQLMFYISLITLNAEDKTILNKFIHVLGKYHQLNQFLFYQHEPLLIRASAMGNDQEVDTLLKRDTMLNLEFRSKRNHTALYIASTLGYPSIVEKLYQHGADIDHAGPNKESAFVAAALHGKKDVIIAMLNIRDNAWYSGMKRREIDKYGNTALHYMVSSTSWPSMDDRMAAIDRYFRSVIQSTSWFGYATYNYSTIMQYTSIQNKEGNTPLHLMVAMCFPMSFIRDIPQRLKLKGLDISRIFQLNIVNCKNQTPLDVAIQMQNSEVVKFLYGLGCRSTYKGLSELSDCLELCNAPSSDLSTQEDHHDLKIKME